MHVHPKSEWLPDTLRYIRPETSGPLSSQSCSNERALFGALWKMPGSSRIFVKFLAAIFPWKLKPGFINRVLVAVSFEASKCL